MAIQQPQSSDYLNSPDHALSHRVIANDDAAPVKSVVVDSAGNVGVGTEGPDEKLHIKGGVCITDSDTCSGNPADGGLWVLGNVSVGSLTDRTLIYEGDALTEIKRIKGKDGKIDHSSLPEFVRKGEKERNIGNMISVNVKAIQQLIEKIEILENQIKELTLIN